MKTIVILGSSNKSGNSFRVAKKLVARMNYELVDLNDYEISYYDYIHMNRDDDYLELMEEIIHNYSTLILVTPVYWYSMSGIMKVFVDRLSDLITVRKELGRMLEGKRLAVITSSSGDNLGEQFWLPFKEMSRYLKMEFIGGEHCIQGHQPSLCIEKIISRIQQV